MFTRLQGHFGASQSYDITGFIFPDFTLMRSFVSYLTVFCIIFCPRIGELLLKLLIIPISYNIH